MFNQLFTSSLSTSILLLHELEAWYKALQGLNNGTLRDYLVLILFTGLRRQEAASLKWEQID